MSLHHAAQHLSAQGRGPDTTLVHMSKDEVKSLNDIAMAHGGHLTINPETGLPEAGFLSAILPMVAGMALGPAGMGLFSSAMTAGLGVGALTGLATGSLSKGLMAGLGAYGGAGLGQGLAASGVEQATQTELAKNQAFAQAQQAATPQALGFGDVATQGIPTPFTPEGYAATVSEAAQPAADIANATRTNATIAAGYGGPNYVTSTLGNQASTMAQGVGGLGSEAGRSAFMGGVGGGAGLAKYGIAAAAPLLSEAMSPKPVQKPAEDKDLGQRYEYSPGAVTPTPRADPYGREQRYFSPSYTPISADRAKSIYGYAEGGVATATPMPGEKPSYEYDPMKQLFAKIESMPSDDQNKQAAEAQAQHGAGPQQPNKAFEAMMATPEGRAAHEAQIGQINSFLSNLATIAVPGMGLAKAMQARSSAAGAAGAGGAGGAHGSTTSAGNVGTGNGTTSSGLGTGIGKSVGNAGGGLKDGGLSDAHYNLGGYSDGGRLLRGPGDGVSDSIPAVIGKKQPARLADGEFVVPARIVSELGNGSTEAGARKLYAMMDRIQSARSKTVGKGKVAKNSRAEKYLPA